MKLKHEMILYFDLVKVIVNVTASGDYTVSRAFDKNITIFNEQLFVEQVLKTQIKRDSVCYKGVDDKLWVNYKDKVVDYYLVDQYMKNLMRDIIVKTPEAFDDYDDTYNSLSATEFANNLIHVSIEQQLFDEVGDAIRKIKRTRTDGTKQLAIMQLEEKIKAYNHWVSDDKIVDISQVLKSIS